MKAVLTFNLVVDFSVDARSCEPRATPFLCAPRCNIGSYLQEIVECVRMCHLTILQRVQQHRQHCNHVSEHKCISPRFKWSCSNFLCSQPFLLDVVMSNQQLFLLRSHLKLFSMSMRGHPMKEERKTAWPIWTSRAPSIGKPGDASLTPMPHHALPVSLAFSGSFMGAFRNFI